MSRFSARLRQISRPHLLGRSDACLAMLPPEMAELVEIEESDVVRAWFIEIGRGASRVLAPFPYHLPRVDDQVLAMRHLAPRLRRLAPEMPRQIRPFYAADEVTEPTGHRWAAFGRPVGRTDVDLLPDAYLPG